MKRLLQLAAILMALGAALGYATGQTTASSTTTATVPETITVPSRSYTVLVPQGQQGPQGIQGIQGLPGTDAICPTAVVQPQVAIDAGDTIAAASGTFDTAMPLDPTTWYVGKVIDAWASGTEILAGEGANEMQVTLGTATLMPAQGQYPNIGPFNTTLLRVWNLHLKLVVVTMSPSAAGVEVSGEMNQYGSQAGRTGTPVGTSISDVAPISVPLAAANLSIGLTKVGYVAGDATTMREFIVQ